MNESLLAFQAPIHLVTFSEIGQASQPYTRTEATAAAYSLNFSIHLSWRWRAQEVLQDVEESMVLTMIWDGVRMAILGAVRDMLVFTAEAAPEMAREAPD